MIKVTGPCSAKSRYGLNTKGTRNSSLQGKVSFGKLKPSQIEGCRDGAQTVILNPGVDLDLFLTKTTDELSITDILAP
jgi:hypothetical protein